MNVSSAGLARSIAMNEEKYIEILNKYIMKLGGKDIPVAEIVRDLRSISNGESDKG